MAARVFGYCVRYFIDEFRLAFIGPVFEIKNSCYSMSKKKTKKIAQSFLILAALLLFSFLLLNYLAGESYTIVGWGL